MLHSLRFFHISFVFKIHIHDDEDEQITPQQQRIQFKTYLYISLKLTFVNSKELCISFHMKRKRFNAAENCISFVCTNV